MNGWQNEGDNWYYFVNGVKITGWREIDDHWYCFNSDGLMLVGWKEVDSHWYYFYEVTDTKNCNYRGAMASGWLYWNEHWYYLCEKSESAKAIYKGVMLTGWIQIGTIWYYLIETTDASKGEYKGQMVCNCTRTINDKSYSFKADGSMISGLVTASQLKSVGWTSIADTMLADLNSCLTKFAINTPARIRHFISQCAHESACGYYMVEAATGVAYEMRSDLGNTQTGDGTKYKGGGYIQLTGRSNYQSFANYIADQEIVNQGAKYVGTNYPWSSAGFWWHNNSMNTVCDNGADCTAVTKRVNGGTNGLSERQRYYDLCCSIF